ncbi:MAG: hypothetical protein FWG66_16095 [Spirochaetes bacterium]|nr:hypothetical protein [Spirochaetota bacterium]
MNLDKILSNKRALYAGLALVAFSLVYTSTLNPLLNRVMHIDTTVYMSITQGLSQGLVLYRDLADNKGPLLYFMSLPGFRLAGLTGVWIGQFVFMYVSLFFMYKTALLFAGAKTAFLTVAFTSLAMHPFYVVHAGVEEYALPFLAASLYIFTKHYLSGKGTAFWEIVVLGFSFAWAIMLRLNMFPLWAGFCLVIVIEAAAKKNFAEIFKYIGAFILGTLAVLFPVFLYLWRSDILVDFYYNVILGSTERGFLLSLQSFVHNFYAIINRSFSFIPLCIAIAWVFIKYKGISNFYFAGFILSYFLSVLFLSFAPGGENWNLILIPFFVPVIAFLSDSFLNSFKTKYKHAALILVFCITFSEGVVRMGFYFFFPIDSGIPYRNAGRIIDENTTPYDTMISLGWGANIYPFANRRPASRFLFQNEPDGYRPGAFDHMPDARGEFIAAILNNPPKIIVFLVNANGQAYQLHPSWHAPILGMMETHYRLLYGDHRVRIFIREDAETDTAEFANSRI